VIGTEGLIPPELLTQLAGTALCQPLIHPADAPPEAGYSPSRPLADFVRCRDMTCRFPGCERPTTTRDLDHTIPYGDGGATHASKVRLLGRFRVVDTDKWTGRNRGDDVGCYLRHRR
jgi:hypothetical protein